MQTVEEGWQENSPRAEYRSRRFYAKPLLRQTIFVLEQKGRWAGDIHVRNLPVAKLGKMGLVTCDEIVNARRNGGCKNRFVFGNNPDVGRNQANIRVADDPGRQARREQLTTSA